jgi:hypothetical protein
MTVVVVFVFVVVVVIVVVVVFAIAVPAVLFLPCLLLKLYTLVASATLWVHGVIMSLSLCLWGCTD